MRGEDVNVNVFYFLLCFFFSFVQTGSKKSMTEIRPVDLLGQGNTQSKRDDSITTVVARLAALQRAREEVQRDASMSSPLCSNQSKQSVRRKKQDRKKKKHDHRHSRPTVFVFS